MKLRLQVFWHVFIWLALMAFFLFIAHNGAKYTNADLLIIFLLYGFINISLFYLNYLVLIPQFLDKKKIRLLRCCNHRYLNCLWIWQIRYRIAI